MNMPHVGPIKWINDTWGYQVVNMGRQGGLATGCVKVWRNDNGDKRVIDRALTVKRARQLMKHYDEQATARLPLPDAYGVTWHQ